MANIIEVDDISICKNGSWKSIKDQQVYANGKWETIGPGSGVYNDNNWYVFKKPFQSWVDKDFIFQIGGVYYAGTVVSDEMNEPSGKREVIMATTAVAKVGQIINRASMGIISISGVAMSDIKSALGTPSSCIVNNMTMGLVKGDYDGGTQGWLWTSDNGNYQNTIGELGYYNWLLHVTSDGLETSILVFNTPLATVTVTNSPDWTEAIVFGAGCFGNLAKTQSSGRPMIYVSSVAQLMSQFMFRSPIAQTLSITKLNSMQMGGGSPITLNMNLVRIAPDKIGGPWPNSTVIGQVNDIVSQVVSGVNATLVLNFDSTQQVFTLRKNP